VAAANAHRRRTTLAERAEINVATAWLNLGRYEECDARLELLLDRYRKQGPPTFVNWTLLLLGYSASFQGRQDLADSYFDEAIAVEVPPGTHSPNKPLEARAAFRRGNRIRSFRILESHMEELLVTDNMQAGSIACIEFINMMAQIGRLTEASRMLDYLETTGLLDAPAWRTLIEGSTNIIASASAGVGVANSDDSMEDRQALEYMRDVLHGSDPTRVLPGSRRHTALPQPPRCQVEVPARRVDSDASKHRLMLRERKTDTTGHPRSPSTTPSWCDSDHRLSTVNTRPCWFRVVAE
jgi:hypothetical protein